MLVRVDPTDGLVRRLVLLPSPGRAPADVALDPDGLLQLEAALTEAAADPRVRLLVLESEGDGCFCRGLDLRALVMAGEPSRPGEPVNAESLAAGAQQGARPGTDAQRAEEAVHRYARILHTLAFAPWPVVTLVDGDAQGGGLGLLAVADQVITTARSKFALPEAYVGLVPAVVGAVLLRRVPLAVVRRWGLFGLPVTADEAQRVGLVDRVEEDRAATERALRQVVRGALRASPTAQRAFIGVLAEQAEELHAPAADTATQRPARSPVAGVATSPAGGTGEAALATALALGVALTGQAVRDPAQVAVIQALLSGEMPPWHATWDPSATGAEP